MGQNFSSTIFFKQKFNRLILENIISLAHTHGFFVNAVADQIFCRKIDDPRGFLLEKSYLVEKIWIEKKKEDYVSFYGKYQDAFVTFMLVVDPYERFSINCEVSNWRKLFPKDPGYQEEEYTFVMDDVARQSRLLLDLVDSFSIDGFSIREDDTEYIEEIPEKTLMSKILREVSFEDMAAMLTKNLLYNRCIMLKSLENSNIYGISEFENELLRNLHSQTDFHFYIRRDNFFAKLNYDIRGISFIPLSPIKKKKYSDEEHIDLAFYVRLLIGLCEDFPILELRTNFWRE